MPGAVADGAGARHSLRARRALRKLAEVDPAFAALSLWVHHRDAEDPPEAGAAAWTDGRCVFYGPEFEAATLDQQVGLAAHQLAHVAFRHVPRERAMLMRFGAGHDPRLFNLAADAILNEMLFLAGHVVPRPCPRLSPLLHEALGERTRPEEAIGQWDVERLYLALRAGRRAGRDVGSDGEDGEDGASPAEQARAYGEAARFAEDLRTEGAEAGGAGGTTAEDIAWRERLTRALAEGRRAGRGLGTLGHRLADLPQSALPWERHLRGLVARALLDDPAPAWQRPTGRWLAMEAEARRRGAAVPVFEPGRRRLRMAPRLVIGLDSSSSVGDADLERFAAEIVGIARRAGGELHVLVFDTAVRSRHRLSAAALAREVAALRPPRKGGTAYGPLVDAALTLAPSALVVLTDLEAPLPPRPGRLPVVWAVPRAPAAAPAWGRVVTLDR